jgi:G3E family GTPase
MPAPLPSAPVLLQVDLVSEAELSSIRQEIAAINADAAVLPCLRCEVDLHHILNTGIYSGSLKGPCIEASAASMEAAAAAAAAAEMAAAAAAEMAAATSLAGSCPGGAALPSQGTGTGAHGASAAPPKLACSMPHQQVHDGGGHCAAEHEQAGEGPCGAGPSCTSHSHGPQHQHGLDVGSRVRTASVVLRDRPLDLRRLRHLLDDLLWEERIPGRPDVFRVKGLLWVQGSVCKHVCQGVYDIYDVVEGPAWQEGEARFSKLVFIGRRLEPHTLETQLQQCLASDGGCK